MKEPKHYPKPAYSKCNKGHELVEVYNEKRNVYEWDCPICKKKMKTEIGAFQKDVLDMVNEVRVWD